MSIVLDGTTGITGAVNLTTTGNTILGDASTDTLNVGNGGLVKDASGNVGIGTASPASTLVVNKNNVGGRGGELSIVNFAVSTLNNSAALNFGLEPSTYSADDGNAQIKAIITNATTAATDIVFSLYNGTTFTEYVRINSTGIVTIPKGVSGTPTFRAYQSGTQSISDTTDTKMTLDAETFDTASCFNNTGSTVGGNPSYSFMPNVAGYYQINGRVGMAVATYNWGFCSIWKNGTLVARGSASNTTSFSGSVVSDVIYLNGSTDYINMYMVISGASSSTENPYGSGYMTYFSGALVRAT